MPAAAAPVLASSAAAVPADVRLGTSLSSGARPFSLDLDKIDMPPQLTKVPVLPELVPVPAQVLRSLQT